MSSPEQVEAARRRILSFFKTFVTSKIQYRHLWSTSTIPREKLQQHVISPTLQSQQQEEVDISHFRTLVRSLRNRFGAARTWNTFLYSSSDIPTIGLFQRICTLNDEEVFPYLLCLLEETKQRWNRTIVKSKVCIELCGGLDVVFGNILLLPSIGVETMLQEVVKVVGGERVLTPKLLTLLYSHVLMTKLIPSDSPRWQWFLDTWLVDTDKGMVLLFQPLLFFAGVKAARIDVLKECVSGYNISPAMLLTADGGNALHVLFSRGQYISSQSQSIPRWFECVHFLLDCGIDVNHKQYDTMSGRSTTPLQMLALHRARHTELLLSMVTLLIDRNAIVDDETIETYRQAHVAKEVVHTLMFRVAPSMAANVSASMSSGVCATLTGSPAKALRQQQQQQALTAMYTTNTDEFRTRWRSVCSSHQLRKPNAMVHNAVGQNVLCADVLCIDLRGAYLGHKTYRCLFECLQYCAHLKSLVLDDTELCQRSIQMLCERLKDESWCPELVLLSVKGNGQVTPWAIGRIQQSLHDSHRNKLKVIHQ
eukprot:PhF_6_TR35379/c0_g1_i4/m.51412